MQVDASLKDPFFKYLNLNESPNYIGSKFPGVLDMNVQPAVDGYFLEPQNNTLLSEPDVPMVDEQPKSQELKFPIDDALLIGHGVSASAPPQAMPSSVPVLYPMIDISETVPASTELLPAADASTSPEEVIVENAVEKTLLKELKEMGFKQVDLNKEILRRNEYDLEQSVDDLCGVSDWDPILEELQEMVSHLWSSFLDRFVARLGLFFVYVVLCTTQDYRMYIVCCGCRVSVTRK
jgi:next-to-BRCA1 protein 1